RRDAASRDRAVFRPGHLAVHIAVNVLVQRACARRRQRSAQDRRRKDAGWQGTALRRDHHSRDRGKDEQDDDTRFGLLEVVAEGACIRPPGRLVAGFDCCCSHKIPLARTMTDQVAAANVTCRDCATTNQSRLLTRTTAAPIAACNKYRPSAA